MKSTSYLLTRLAIGMSFFGHGVVRMPKLAAFSKGMAGEFQKSYLPQVLVVPFCYVLPFAELIVGILLLLGLFTRQAAIAGAIVMILLIFGTTTVENWNILPTQLLHVAFLVVVVEFAPDAHKKTPA